MMKNFIFEKSIKILFFRRPKFLALDNSKNIDVINFYLKIKCRKKVWLFLINVANMPF